MFAYIIEKLSNWFEAAERERREAYLASSSDIVQLEQRIRSLETTAIRCNSARQHRVAHPVRKQRKAPY
ncbi:hypothetical protein SY87_32825 [Burkholderia pseudomallei]|nr:hypothetical protein SY87_32825 [Burkholderia pseudomallei]